MSDGVQGVDYTFWTKSDIDTRSAAETRFSSFHAVASEIVLDSTRKTHQSHLDVIQRHHYQVDARRQRVQRASTHRSPLRRGFFSLDFGT
jgi:hypothetical protein